MARLKSSWELAMERTQDIEIDKEKFKRDDNVKKARTASGLFINDEDGNGDIKKELDAINDKDAVKEGVLMTVMQNLFLPSETVLTDRYERVLSLISLLCKNNAEIMDYANQLIAFIKQYPEHQKQLVDQLREQLKPMLEEKAAQLKQKYGQDIPLSIENDKEAMKIAENQLSKLKAQYDQALTDGKAQLEGLLRNC